MGDTRTRLEQVLREAQSQQLLPDEAALGPQDSRPWPVVLLTAIGAWFAAIPLIAMVSILLGDIGLRGVGPYVIGALALAGAIVVLRSRDLGVFVEQLAVPALLVGAGTMSFGLARDLQMRGATAVLCLLAVGVAVAIPRGWIRALLGAAAAGLAVMTLTAQRAVFNDASALWLPLQLVVLAGLALWLAQARVLAQAREALLAAALEPFAAGWMVAALWGLAWWSGLTFLAGGLLGTGFEGQVARMLFGGGGRGLAIQASSVLLAVAAAAVLAHAWPSVRRPLATAVALVLAALAWFMPALGAALLAAAAAAATRRWLLAGFAALVCAWIVGAFYYQLDWPLATKALVLAAAGAVLAALAWFAQPRQARSDAARRVPRDLHPPLWIATAALATLAFANYAIWDKERLIAQGDRVLVALAPVDPRSLMQGDFMRLAYRVPDAGLQGTFPGARRPFVIARRDARGVAELLRVGHEGEPLAPGEFRIELTPKDGRWTLVNDAWYFREGDGARWQAARFAEFRVDRAGHALLVGLADDKLRPIRNEP